MAVEVDPLRRETDALFALAEFAGRRVLEIGSGDGRLTWRYARHAAHVTAVEPFGPAHERARAGMPPDLRDRVTLVRSTLAEFAVANPASSFDLALFSWSLCCFLPAGMVDALTEVHRLLRPEGVLIDIHPLPEPLFFEVRRDGVVFLSVPEPDSYADEYRSTDEALDEVVRRRLFTREDTRQFDFFIVATSVSELRAFLQDANAFVEEVGEPSEEEKQLDARLHDALRSAEAGGRVVTHEVGRAARFGRVP